MTYKLFLTTAAKYSGAKSVLCNAHLKKKLNQTGDYRVLIYEQVKLKGMVEDSYTEILTKRTNLKVNSQ